jgi:hypothetical protein
LEWNFRGTKSRRKSWNISLTRLAWQVSLSFQALAAHIEEPALADAPDYEFMHDKPRREMPEVRLSVELTDMEGGAATAARRWDSTGDGVKLSPSLPVRKKKECAAL